MPPRALLLQARLPADPMVAHELACFVERTGLPADHVVPHDLLAGPPTLSRVGEHDCLLIGGSGAFYVSKRNLPGAEALAELLREVVGRGLPTFASCFGYHSLIDALGGRIVHDPDRTEVGTFDLELSPEGAADELFGALPARFTAQLGHKDRADRAAPGTVNLASSDRCGFQALRVPGKPIWATQFHPELTERTNRDRYMAYLEAYSQHLGPDARLRAASLFRESAASSGLLSRFVALVFG